MENQKIPRRFDFYRDRFAFANELRWQYQSDPATGRMDFRPRSPTPEYTHRCFVLVRAARLFLYHTRWEPGQGRATEEQYRRWVDRVLARCPRRPSAPGQAVVFPGYSGLHEFSRAHAALLKASCGGAWRSYVLRSHWRMVLPISRAHQAATAARLMAALGQNVCPIIHLVTFPALTINHGMIAYDVRATAGGAEFLAYDPNDPANPAVLQFDQRRKTFSLPPNRYWAGGDLNLIQIYRSWLI
jgi:hypothetical protein